MNELHSYCYLMLYIPSEIDFLEEIETRVAKYDDVHCSLEMVSDIQNEVIMKDANVIQLSTKEKNYAFVDVQNRIEVKGNVPH